MKYSLWLHRLQAYLKKHIEKRRTQQRVKEHRRNYQQCYNAAFTLMALGQTNPNQASLDKAKDQLYLTAHEFDILAQKEGTS
jgi:hypothetical protein